jgi:hypothetical protein
MADILIERAGVRVTVDDSTLEKRELFESRPNEFVIAVEWREAGVLVKRDCHLILKTPSVVADALCGGIG